MSDLIEPDYMDHLVHNLLIPGACVLFGYLTLVKVYQYIQTLYVSGGANEWVLILNNGNLKTCGIGMSTFRGPFDQVVRFPSKVNKVTFESEKVTKENQGIKVRGMLVWSINREENGPFTAYKSLGEDLAHEIPTTANEILVKIADAIVRDTIFNSSIYTILKTRNEIREIIRTKMTKDLRGWGVWLETVEITDVTISSNSIFKDLQADFREKQKLNAEKWTGKYKEDLSKLRTEKELEMKVITDKYGLEIDAYRQKIRLEIDNQIAQDNEEIAKIELQIKNAQAEHEQNKSKYANETQLKQKAETQKLELEQLRIKKETIAVEQKTWDSNFEIEKQATAHRMATAKQDKDFENAVAQKEKELIVANTDANVIKYNAIKSAKQAFNNRKVTVTSTVSNPNDTVNNLIQTWFQQKALSK